MSDDTPVFGKLPITNVADGTRISDINGVVYTYNAATDTWIQNGVIKTPPVVTESQDGLVYPSLYRKLNLIKLLKANGINWDNFQFATNHGFKPYFYYFNSSDGLIKFIPESTNRLRIEIDRSKLYSRILSLCCVGPKGDTGAAGAAGIDGKPAANEAKHKPVLQSDGSYFINVNVNIPIDTPISIRFYNKSNDLISETLVNLDGTIIADDNVEISSTNITLKSLSDDTVTISGTITLLSDLNDLYYKARQKGPVGNDGKDGLDHIEVIEDIFSDTGVQSKEALIAIRKSGVDDNLTFVKQEMFVKNIFSSISGITDLPLDDIENTEYISLRVNTDDCKDIGKFKFIAPTLDIGSLDIPAWTPMCNCTDTFRYQIQKFDWYKNTSNQLPFSLVQEPPPPEKCCQEDFYFCPNQGDLCGVVGMPTAPNKIPMRSEIQQKKSGGSSGSSPDSTPPDAPPFVPCNLVPLKDIELNGNGVILPIITDNGENIDESVVLNRGKSDQYIQTIEFTQFNSEFTITIDIQIGNRDGTFEGGTSFVVPIDNPSGTPTEEQTDNPCALQSSTVLVASSGAIAMILPSPSQEVQHDAIQNGGNSIKRIVYTGLAMSEGASVKLFINVNNTLLDCCLPYAIKTTVATVVAGSDGSGSGSSDASAGSSGGDNDFTDNGLTPASDNPIARTPETPIIRPLINPPDITGDEADIFANAAAGDVPMEPDYAWRPVAINRPVLQNLTPQISGMLIGETNREIEVNANLSDRIIIDIATPRNNTDPRSVTFPINGDPTVGEMLWTISRIEFERDGLYMPSGPLGAGFYFLQKSNFVVSSRFTKLNNIQTRTDTFGNGFLYISGTSLTDVDGPTSISIISYGIDWTTNNFVDNISGFGSNWIRQVNRGVEEVGDALFQLILDSNLNIIRDISTAQKVSYTDAFVSLLYNPFGCATINIPQTVTSISGAILGGRNGPECQEVVISSEVASSEVASSAGPVAQEVYVSFSPTSSTEPGDIPSTYGLTVIMTTSDGLDLTSTVSVDVDDVIGTLIEGIDYSYAGPQTATFIPGNPSGTTASTPVTISGVGSNGTETFQLSNAVGCTIVSGTFVLTLVSGGA